MVLVGLGGQLPEEGPGAADEAAMRLMLALLRVVRPLHPELLETEVLGHHRREDPDAPPQVDGVLASAVLPPGTLPEGRPAAEALARRLLHAALAPPEVLREGSGPALAVVQVPAPPARAPPGPPPPGGLLVGLEIRSGRAVDPPTAVPPEALLPAAAEAARSTTPAGSPPAADPHSS